MLFLNILRIANTKQRVWMELGNVLHQAITLLYVNSFICKDMMTFWTRNVPLNVKF